MRLFPGVRLNFSGSGVSLGLGPRGANVNISKRGVRQTFGIPGTGISHQSSTPWPKSPSPVAPRAIPVAAPPPATPVAASSGGSRLPLVIGIPVVVLLIWVAMAKMPDGQAGVVSKPELRSSTEITADGFVWKGGARIGYVDRKGATFYSIDQINAEPDGRVSIKEGQVGVKMTAANLATDIESYVKSSKEFLAARTPQIVKTADNFVWMAGKRVGWVDSAKHIYYRIGQLNIAGEKVSPKVGEIGDLVTDSSLAAIVERIEREPSNVVKPPLAQAVTNQQTPASIAMSRSLQADEVREAQVILKSLGFDLGEADGLIGPNTIAAVKRYEATRNWPVSGAVDLRLLESLRSGKTSAAPVAAPPKPAAVK